MRTPVILVVDDEVLLRLLAAEHLSDAGFEVLEAANGAEAMALMSERHDIKAVVTDVRMPGGPNGLELARAVREACPGAIVVVSGRAVPAAGELAERAYYVPKPYGGREVRLVEGLLAA